jgi:hypothetical protein
VAAAAAPAAAAKRGSGWLAAEAGAAKLQARAHRDVLPCWPAGRGGDCVRGGGDWARFKGMPGEWAGEREAGQHNPNKTFHPALLPPHPPPPLLLHTHPRPPPHAPAATQPTWQNSVVRSTRTPWRYSRLRAALSVAFLPTLVLYQCTAPRSASESCTSAVTKASSPPGKGVGWGGG